MISLRIATRDETRAPGALLAVQYRETEWVLMSREADAAVKAELEKPT